MLKKSILSCFCTCAMALAIAPVIEWSFDGTIDADYGGAGIVQDIASKNGGVGVKAVVSGTQKADGLIVNGLRGGAYRIHHDSVTKQPVTLSYTPKPPLNSLAGAISFWIRPEWDGKENARRIFYSADSGKHRIIIFRLPNIPHITFYYGQLKGDGVTSLPVDISKWKKGQWHHLAMTWDKDSMVVLVDGKRSVLKMKTVFPDEFGKIMIGENWGDKSGETIIDELTVYNEKLTDSELGALYNSKSKELMRFQSMAPVTVKLGRATPLIDGQLDEGEYAFSASGMRNIRDNTAFAAQQSRCFLSYDDENLYMGIFSPYSQRHAPCNTRDKLDARDDSVELWLKFPNEGDFYQLIWNSAGNVYDRKGGDTAWNVSSSRHASKVNGNNWIFECAIPWKNFPFELKKGNKFRFDICRSYAGSSEFTSLGNGAHAYGIIPCFAEAEISPDAPMLNLGFLGNLPSGQIDCTGMIRSTKNDTVKISFCAGHGLYPLDYDRKIQLTAGKDAVFNVKNSNIPQNAVLDIFIESEKQGTLYSNSFPYKELQEIKFDTLYTLIAQQKLIFRFQNRKPFGQKFIFKFAIRDKEGKVLMQQQEQIPNDSPMPEVAFDVSALQYGVFSLEYSILDANGNVVVADSEHYGKYHDNAWGSDDGMEDTIPPPWTPMTATDNGFSCWGRKVALGKNSFMTSMKSQDLELLSAPVDVVLNGKTVPFESKLVKECVSYKEYVLHSKGCSPKLELKLKVEFDGVVWCSLVSGIGTIDSLKLQIPLNRKCVDSFDDCSSIFEKKDLTAIKNKTIFVDSVMKPFWWCGCDKIGLMGGVTSQRGRFLKDKQKSLAVNVREDDILLELALVDTRLKVDFPRTFSFYLQPTPVKPKNHSLARIRNDRNAWTFASDVSAYFAYGKDGFWNEEQIRKIHSYRERDPNWTNFWYMASKGASPYVPEWGWFCHDWHDCFPNFAVYQTDAAVKNKTQRNRGVFTYGCMNARSFMEFKFDLAKERLKRPEIVNLYYDLSWPKPCHNPHHGCTWKDDFGYEHHEYDLFPLREYYLRVYRCMKKKDPNSMMAGHVISTRLPSDSFFDMLWLGEAYDIKVARNSGYYDVLTPDVMRIAYANRSNEMTIVLIAQFGRALQLFAPDKYANFHPDSPENQKAFKHYYAYIFLHNLNSSMTYSDQEYLKVQDKLGWGSGKIQFYGYWREDSPLRIFPEGKRYLASCYKGNGNFFAVFLNDTDTPVELSLNVDFKKAEILPGTVGVEISNGEVYPFVNGIQNIKFSEREAKMILFTKNK
ncbi:MAG: hypothetical protein IJJ33_19145 [Victivallales bacterium]|nr:hypothetical protein [Victivallales bacterium]